MEMQEELKMKIINLRIAALREFMKSSVNDDYFTNGEMTKLDKYNPFSLVKCGYNLENIYDAVKSFMEAVGNGYYDFASAYNDTLDYYKSLKEEKEYVR